MIKAVFCDLGDTLINFHHLDVFDAFELGARETYAFLQKELKLVLPPFQQYHRRQQWAIRWAFLKSQITGREFNSMEVMIRCARKFGITLPADQLQEISWRWYQPLAERAKADPFAVPMLQSLQKMGIRLAIISNTFVPGSSLDRHLKQELLYEYFPLRIYSCEFGLRKPRPEIFHYGLRLMKVSAEESLFIGDSYSADIKGSRRVGMYAIFKSRSSRRLRLDPKTFMVHSLQQIPDIIDKINRNL
jgi:HAD superfamily hydrolase (TIGR01549 family)